jgi:hypothetical protein
MFRFSARFKALQREAGLAAQLLGSGVTILRSANHAQDGYYDQALFNLSIGLERAAKLALVLDHCINTRGQFPTDAELRREAPCPRCRTPFTETVNRVGFACAQPTLQTVMAGLVPAIHVFLAIMSSKMRLPATSAGMTGGRLRSSARAVQHPSRPALCAGASG